MKNRKGGRPMKKENTASYLCFRIIRWIIWLFYPKIKIEGLENLPQEPCFVVGNHTQMNGPICAELHFPGNRRTWCAHQMMELKEVPAYAYQDFWSNKPKPIRWFFRLLSYIIAPVSVCVFNNALTIPVYRDNRLIKTFKQTTSALQDGANVIIFPECYEPHNHIVHQFQDKFVDVAKLYYDRTGTELFFVPLYIAPALKKMCLGKPIRYNALLPKEKERQRICQYLMDEITDIAENLPKHKVVPYPNVPKSQYPFNISEENVYEKTGG